MSNLQNKLASLIDSHEKLNNKTVITGDQAGDQLPITPTDQTAPPTQQPKQRQSKSRG